MAAPVVAVARNARKIKAGITRPELLRRVRSRERRRARSEEPLKAAQQTTTNRFLPRARRLRKKLAKKGPVGGRAIKALGAQAALMPLLLFYPLQFIASMLLLSSVVLLLSTGEFTRWLASFFVSAEAVAFGSALALFIIGFLSFAYAIFIFSMRGVNCFKGNGGLVLMGYMLAYIVPFASLVPWVFLYGWYVVKQQ